MTLLATLLSCLLAFLPMSWAEEPDSGLPADINDPAALQEATRVLGEELKLAARPHTYLLIDLVGRAVLMKGRGVELHRLPIERWRASNQADLASPFILRERPPIARRKIDPTAGAEQDPISLNDMPTEYELRLSPPLTILIEAQPPEAWRWALQLSRSWWRQLTLWWTVLSTGNSPTATPFLYLSLRPEQAQSLAWTVTDNMPILIRRTSAP